MCPKKIFTETDKATSITIDNIRFPLAVLVVFIHSFGLPGVMTLDIDAMQSAPLNHINIYNYIRILFSDTLPRLAVPAFFVISGYYFFFKSTWNRSTYTKKLRRRIFTLLIPYVLWNFLFLLRANHFHPANISAIELLRAITWYPADFPLWFIRQLIVLVTLSPIIHYVISRFGKLTIALGVAIVTLGNFATTSAIESSLFWFGVGSYFSIKGIDFVELGKRHARIPAILALLFALIAAWNNNFYTTIGDVAHRAFLITGVAALFGFAGLLEEKTGGKKLNATLKDSVFFIYALHVLIILNIGPYLNALFASHTPLIMTLRYFATPVATIVICTLMYALLRKMMPKPLAILTGSR